jgi:Ca2+/Na+ antiporter
MIDIMEITYAYVILQYLLLGFVIAMFALLIIDMRFNVIRIVGLAIVLASTLYLLDLSKNNDMYNLGLKKRVHN